MGQRPFSFADYEARLATVSLRVFRRTCAMLSPSVASHDFVRKGCASGRRRASLWPGSRCAPGRPPPILPRQSAGGAPASLDRLLRWAHLGRDIAEQSSVVAAAYFRAGPRASAALPDECERWAASGQRLYQGIGSRSRWRRCSSRQPGATAADWRSDLIRLELLQSYWRSAPMNWRGTAWRRRQRVPAHRSEDRTPLLDLAAAIGDASWADVRICFETRADLLAPVEARSAALPALSAAVAGTRGATRVLAVRRGGDGARAGRRTAITTCFRWQRSSPSASPVAAMEFLKSAPEVLKRIRFPNSRAGRPRGTAFSSRASRAARPTSVSSPARARRCWRSSRRASSCRASAECCVCTARR